MSAKNYFTADVISYSDYHPFGMLMPNRHGQDDDYRYGFNGMEKDDEVRGTKGASYDYGARMLDVRIGRWLSVDPLEAKYPGYSPYNFVLNSPLIAVDPDGKEVKLVIKNSYTAKWKLENIHDLGNASYIIAGLATNFNKKTNMVDVEIIFNVKYSNLFSPMAKDNIERQNPGLQKEVEAHEESHVDQFFEAATSGIISVKVSKNGHIFGDADVVLTEINKMLNKQSEEYFDELKTEVQKKIDNKEFNSQEEVDNYMEEKMGKFNKQQAKKWNGYVQEVGKQLQEHILKKYDKSKMSKDDVQDVEDDANKRAAKKLKGNVKYLNGKKQVTHNGKTVPAN